MAEAASGMSSATKIITNILNTLRRQTDCAHPPAHQTKSAAGHPLTTLSDVEMHFTHLLFTLYRSTTALSMF